MRIRDWSSDVCSSDLLSGGRGSCVACHAVGGTDASSVLAPDLTHFADPTHECFAGCNWETTDREALEAWLRNPDAVKLGDRTSVVEGKSVSVRVDLGGRRLIKTNKNT